MIGAARDAIHKRHVLAFLEATAVSEMPFGGVRDGFRNWW
jgi:hypothetical protein